MGREPQPPADVRVAKRAGLITRVGIVGLMVLGVLAMFAIPVGLVYVVSQAQDSTQPSLGPYMLIFVGIVVGMVTVGKLLGTLDRYYGRRTGSEEDRRRAAWLQSMRGERRNSRDEGWKVLDMVLIWTVGISAVLFGVWFFFFAGAPK